MLDRQDLDAIKRHLSQVYWNKTLKERGEFHIDILWENQGDLMTDVWRYSQSKQVV